MFVKNTKSEISISLKVAIFFLIVLGFSVPRFFGLNQFVAVDEVNWLQRSANFYDALLQKDFSRTYVNDSPGVITTWIGALAFRIELPYYRINRSSQSTSYFMFERTIKALNSDPFKILVTARVLMLIFLASICYICFYYGIRLFGFLPTAVGFLFIAIDPFITAISRTNHLDAPMAELMLLSLLAFSSYFFNGKRKFDVFVSGAAGGMAVLAKMPGLFIIPIIFLLAIISLWWRREDTGYISKKDLINLVILIFSWMLVFCMVFILFWPSMWVNPIGTLTQFSRSIFWFSSTTTEFLSLENGDLINQTSTTVNQNNSPNDLGETSSKPKENQTLRMLEFLLRYPKSFIWRSTPIVLIGIIVLIIFLFQVPKNILWNRRFVGFWIFIFIYVVGISLPTKTSEKYFAPIFFISCIIAGVGWYRFSDFIISKTKRNIHQVVLLLLLITFQTFSSIHYFPYYFTYYNPMLGGLQKASKSRFIGVGEGLDVAARYLNTKTDSEELRVMAWYGIGPFSYFFDGFVEPLYFSTPDMWTDDFVCKLERMDYLVIYTNQKFRKEPAQLFEILNKMPPVYIVEIDGAEYAWIYNVREMPFGQKQLVCPSSNYD
jgi:4-amino-4-deoxy-L-arabinose transferase-like glycosyltransferase